MKRAGRTPSQARSEQRRPSATRLLVLLGALLVVVGAYLATSRWRQGLWEESARSRTVIAAVERARAACERQAARERELETTLQLHPDQAELRLELAQLRWAEAGPAAAAAVLQSGRSTPTDLRVLRLLAAAQRATGREDLALATLDRASRRAPADGDLWAQRAMLFSLLGWFPQAEAALKDAQQRHAEPLQITLVRVTMARQQGDLRAARRELEQARSRSPQDPELIKQLAAVAEAEGHAAEATRLLEPLAESEADPELWVALARLYLRQGETGDGRRETVVGSREWRSRMPRPSLPSPVFRLPSPVSQARAALQRALALRPGMPAARLLMGRCLRRSGELREARSLLELLYRERPQQASILFELAQLYRELGMADRAGPLMAQYQDRLRQHEAMRRAAMAAMAHPQSAAAHREVGRLCLERGMIGQAILSLERAQALDPRLPGVRQALAHARQTPSSTPAPEEP